MAIVMWGKRCGPTRAHTHIDMDIEGRRLKMVHI